MFAPILPILKSPLRTRHQSYPIFPSQLNSLLPPGHNDEYMTAKINSCAQLGALPESEVASTAEAFDPTSRLSSPRSIHR